MKDDMMQACETIADTIKHDPPTGAQLMADMNITQRHHHAGRSPNLGGLSRRPLPKHRGAHAAHLRGAESPNVKELW